MFSAGCTTIGTASLEDIKSHDFGGEQTLRMCIYKDTTVSDAQTEKMIAVMKKEFLPFGIKVEIPWVRDWKRPAFPATGSSMTLLRARWNRRAIVCSAWSAGIWGTFLWGIILPEILGAVEETTMTKGYAVAEWGSLNQVLALRSPENLMVHETYHLLGCGHGLNAGLCLDQIVRMKKAAQRTGKRVKDSLPEHDA